MSKQELPGFVPIPSVEEYTDQVHIGASCLPVGFDPESLELNVKNVVRTARLFCIDKTIITGYRGETTQYSYGASSVGRDGSATLATSRVHTREKLGQGELDPLGRSQLPLAYQWGTAALKINNSEIDEKIRADGDKWSRGMVDPVARSRYMDGALKSALRDTAKENLLTNRRIAGFLFVLGTTFGISGLGFHVPLDTEAVFSVMGYLPANLADHALNKLKYGKELPPRAWSNMFELPLDRLIGGMALTKLTRFIRATPSK